MAAGLIKFRVYPEDRSLYAVVNVWETKKAMREHVAKCSGFRGRYEAITSNLAIETAAGRLKQQFAEVNFHWRYIGIGCVAHEMFHVTCAWARRRRLWLTDNPPDAFHCHDSEESFAGVTGNLVRQFVLHANRFRLYD